MYVQTTFLMRIFQNKKGTEKTNNFLTKKHLFDRFLTMKSSPFNFGLLAKSMFFMKKKWIENNELLAIPASGQRQVGNWFLAP